MLHVAIIGSGPSGYYTAEALVKALGAGVQVDIVDRLPTPFGLIRAGVAPDHQSIKAVTRRYDATATAGGVAFVGNVEVGRDVSIAELGELYDAVVLATGAPADRLLGIPGEELPGVIGSAAFVGWYNGHPDFADLEVPLAGGTVAVIGNGNVAIDVARILAKTPDELAESDIAAHAAAALAASAVTSIHLIGRRGPHQASFTPKEMGELGHLARAQPRVVHDHLPHIDLDAPLEPGLRKTVGHLRSFAAAEPTAKPLSIHFDFFNRPVSVEATGGALRLTLERTRLEGDSAVGTGVTWTLDCGLIVPCIGYRTLSPRRCAVRCARRTLRQRRRQDRARAVRRRLGAARPDGHDRHQPRRWHRGCDAHRRRGGGQRQARPRGPRGAAAGARRARDRLRRLAGDRRRGSGARAGRGTAREDRAGGGDAGAAALDLTAPPPPSGRGPGGGDTRSKVRVAPPPPAPPSSGRGAERRELLRLRTIA